MVIYLLSCWLSYRWQLKLATLQLREGQTFDLLNTPDQPSVPAQEQKETQDYDVDLDQSTFSR